MGLVLLVLAALAMTTFLLAAAFLAVAAFFNHLGQNLLEVGNWLKRKRRH